MRSAIETKDRPIMRRRRVLLLSICIILAALTWAVFGQTIGHPFSNYDDQEYVFENPRITGGLTLAGVLWVFTHPHASNWHPLTSISHMLDCQLYGLKAGGHHFTNVWMHALAAILLFLALRDMTGALWRSTFVAAVFAIHPLRAESVAWIAERKDVLSGVFFMLTLSVYVGYVRRPSLQRYLAMSILFALGLMCKPMLVTMPFVLLLLDYWPLGRFGQTAALQPSDRTGRASWWNKRSPLTRLILEKIPLLVLSIASCAATLFAQKRAFSSIDDLPLLWRTNNAVVSYLIYIGQMLYPLHLAVFYPHPEYHLSLGEVGIGGAALTAVTAAVFILRKRYPYLMTGWFWYVGMLLPVIGIVQVGFQARADRYTYLPQIGLYVLLTWLIVDLLGQWRYRQLLLTGLAAFTIGWLARQAWIQTHLWRDSEALWTHTLAVTSHNDVAHANLADLLLRRDRLVDAIFHSEEALRIRPRNGNAHNTLALALFRTGHGDEAIAHWKESLEIRPDDMNAQGNLAWVLATYPDASMRDGARAVRLVENVIEQAGHANAILLRTLGAAYAECGRFSDAINAAERALELARQQGNSALEHDLQLNIENYQRNLPLRDRGL